MTMDYSNISGTLFGFSYSEFQAEFASARSAMLATVNMMETSNYLYSGYDKGYWAEWANGSELWFKGSETSTGFKFSELEITTDAGGLFGFKGSGTVNELGHEIVPGALKEVWLGNLAGSGYKAIGSFGFNMDTLALSGTAKSLYWIADADGLAGTTNGNYVKFTGSLIFINGEVSGGTITGMEYGTVTGLGDYNEHYTATAKFSGLHLEAADVFLEMNGDESFEPLLVASLVGNNKIVGTEGIDVLYGYEGNDTIAGLGGDDVIFSGLGNDKVTAGEGNNYVSDDGGNNTITAGSGNDTIYLQHDGNDKVTAGDGTNYVFDWGNGNNVVTTGSGNDVIELMGHGSNKITAGDGNNMVVSYGEKNTIVTGAGNDEIVSLGGNDTIKAGAGSDRIISVAGKDSVDLGQDTDADTFFFDANFYVALGDGNPETAAYVAVKNFNVGDHLSLNYDYLALPESALLIGSDVTTNDPGGYKLVFNTSSGKLYYDADGTGNGNAAVQIALIKGNGVSDAYQDGEYITGF